MSWSITYGHALRITVYHGESSKYADIHNDDFNNGTNKYAWAVPVSGMTRFRVLIRIASYRSRDKLRFDVQGHLLKDLALHRIKHHKYTSCSSILTGMAKTK